MARCSIGELESVSDTSGAAFDANFRSYLMDITPFLDDVRCPRRAHCAGLDGELIEGISEVQELRHVG